MMSMMTIVSYSDDDDDDGDNHSACNDITMDMMLSYISLHLSL